MQIVEQSSTCLVLKNPAILVWFTRAISAIFFTVGCLALFLAITEGGAIEGFLFAGIFICLGLFIGFLAVQKIVCFDRNLGKVTIKTFRLFSKQILEYNLEEITALRTLKTRRYRSNNRVYYSYNIILTLNHSQQISLSGIDLKESKATQIKNLIWDFLKL